MSGEFKKQKFAVNEYLLKAGERSDSAYLILDGKVEIRLGAMGDEPKTLAVLGKGDGVGEMSLFDNTPHMASAIAIEKTVASTLSADEFNRRIAAMDPLMRGMFKILVKRIRRMGEQLNEDPSSASWVPLTKTG